MTPINSLLLLIGLNSIMITCYMSILCVLGHRLKKYSIVDIGWGAGFMLIALTSLAVTPSITQRALFVTLLVCVWAIRITSHIYMRSKGTGEDPRYTRMLARWNDPGLLTIWLKIFMLQGALMLIIALPIMFIINSPDGHPQLDFLDLLGFSLWLIGLFFESVADYQLYIFLQCPENRGLIMQEGLWRYSRHPNYFGEMLIWWGIYVIALNIPYGYATVVSPLLITYLLRFVSGVPPAEKQMKQLDDFDQYKEETSIFVPWFKKG